MKTIKLKGIDEKVYHDTCDNGLEIYIWTSKKVHSFLGTMNVYYGGDVLEYSVKNKKYQLHGGIAHYLEHMICNDEDGNTMLAKFNELGCYSNAHTSAKATRYEFSGTKNMSQSIKLLLQTIFEKKFTEEPIERERNPILEERRMHQDDPNRVAYYTLNDLLFHKYPIKYPLIGSEEDILAINQTELETVYEHFYHPKNMSFVITGNVDPYEVVKIIKEYFQDKTFKEYVEPKLKNYRENAKIHKKEAIIKTNVEKPEIYISIKLPLKEFSDIPLLKLLFMIRIVLAANFGSTTLFKEELLEKKLLYGLYFSAYFYKEYIMIELSCETKYPEEMKKILIERLHNLEFKKKDLERKIKSLLATLVLSYEDVEEVNDILSTSLITQKEIISNEKEIMESVKFSEIKELFGRISMEQMVTLIVYPKRKNN